MAVLSAPTLDLERAKIEMLEKYLNIMCEKRKLLEKSMVSTAESPQSLQLQSPTSPESLQSLPSYETDFEETWSSIFDLDENYPKQPIISTEFLRFSELDKKLRRHIWRFARPEARYIKIRESRWGEQLISNAPIPAMLRTCRESRKVAMEWYDLSFARDAAMGFWSKAILKKFMEDALTRPSKPLIWFDWERDGLYSQCASCHGDKMSCRYALLSFDFLRVKRLAFESPLSCKPFYKIAMCFPVAESIILIRGRSTILRKAVSPSEFIPTDEKFGWEGEDLLTTCLETIKKTAPRCDALESIKSVQRMTLSDVKQTQLMDQEGKRTWSCH